MRVLIVEDNAFNAYCLRRLFESLVSSISVTIVNNSQAALSEVSKSAPDLMIIDGDLGVDDGLHCNGPSLADLLLQKHPSFPIIAWSDSETMRQAFTKTFSKHNKPSNEHNTWTKVVSLERICKTLTYYFGPSLNNQNKVFASGSPCRGVI